MPVQVYADALHAELVPAGWPAVSTPVLRALAGKPGAAKRALQDQFGAPAADSSGDGMLSHALTFPVKPCLST